MFEGPCPRKLEEEEFRIISRVLPDNKSGYKRYRELIIEYFFTGAGNSANSIIMSKDPEFVNNMPFVTHVFAAGSFDYMNKEINIVVHEELEETIEIEIDFDDLDAKSKDVIYSEWIPGMKTPGDNLDIREISILGRDYILAIAPSHKKLWIYNNETGVNHFISTGPFYSDLCLVKNLRDPNLVLKPVLLFENLDTYTDNELISAFHLYNKSTRRFLIKAPGVVSRKKAGFLSKIFNKDKN